MNVENQSKFCFVGHFLNREFVGQKALNEDNEKIISGESVEEIFDALWISALHFIKREVMVDGENFVWAENEKPTQAEIDKFITLQDQGSKKNHNNDASELGLLAKIAGKARQCFRVFLWQENLQQNAAH